MRSRRRFCPSHAAACLVFAACSVWLTGCAPKRIALPTDPGAPLPDFAQIHEQVSSQCRGARTVTAELALSGRAGDQKLRGRVVFGFERPDAMRLEGVAPFGSPAFILVARDGEATLLLPRDERVVRGAAPESVLGALTGVTLSPADLGALVTGCVVANPRPIAGHLHTNGWASIDLDGGASIFLQRAQDGWHVRAARRGEWEVEYPEWQGRFPTSVRLRSDARASVDVTAAISQLEVNVDVPASAFTVTIPPGVRALSIDELRANGPLREQDRK